MPPESSGAKLPLALADDIPTNLVCIPLLGLPKAPPTTVTKYALPSSTTLVTVGEPVVFPTGTVFNILSSFPCQTFFGNLAVLFAEPCTLEANTPKACKPG